jgi:long-subunit fatty acid transport protein
MPYRSRATRWLPFSLLCLATLAVPAHGAGLGLREFGAPLNGTASAGWAALGEDASTAATNPAAMTRLKQSEFLAGPQVLVVDIEFDTEQSSFAGGDGGNAGGLVPAGGLSYVHKVSPDLALGFSTGSYLGLGLDFDDDWAGRYFVTKGELVTMAAGPSISSRTAVSRTPGTSRWVHVTATGHSGFSARAWRMTAHRWTTMTAPSTCRSTGRSAWGLAL